MIKIIKKISTKKIILQLNKIIDNENKKPFKNSINTNKKNILKLISYE